MGKRFVIIGAALILSAQGTAKPRAAERFAFVEPHMGTRFQIIVYAGDAMSARKASKAAFARVVELNRIMSDYDRTSELMQLCEKAGGKPVKVSEELFLVLSRAQALSKKTDGAFDVSIGPVTKLWRVSRKRFRLPDPQRLKADLRLVGYRKIKLDKDKRTVELALPKMRLDLGGITKGYAADEAIRVLKMHGIKSALVAAGGDIVVNDPPPGKKGWKVGIAPLTSPDVKPEHYLVLKNAAVSTSGDAEQYVDINGKRYSHIVDPRTGVGVPGQFSVTVIASKGIDSDSLATAISVLGHKEGLKLIEEHADRAALIVRKVDKKKVTIRSKRFDRYLLDSDLRQKSP